MTVRARVGVRAGDRVSRPVWLVVVLGVGAVLGLGCSSDDDTVVTVQGEERRLVSIDPADDGTELVDYTSSAMGGVRFSADPAQHLHMPGDSIVVSISDPAEAKGWETASIGLVTQTADGVPIGSVDQIIELLEATPSVEVTSTGTAIELLGHRLAGYDIRADPSTRDFSAFSADRVGSPPMALFSYFPNARIFLAETPAGVLVAASAEADEAADIEMIDGALGTLIESIELTGPGLDEPLPPGQALELEGVTASGARGELDPAGPEALDTPFTSAAPGLYQLANFGPTFTLDLRHRWDVQPNFPGFIVLTVPASGGPGDRDLVFVTGVVDLVPIGAGPVQAGDPTQATDLDAVLEAIGRSFEVRDVAVVDLGGAQATRFDARIRGDAACTRDEPCEYAFRTSSGVVKQFRSTHDHRIWWIEDGVEGPSMIVAMTPIGDDFIDRATDLLDTMTFSQPIN